MRWDLLHGLEGKSAPELPAPTFVLFMLPTLQELASYMIALCSTMPEAGAAIQEAEGELASCDFDSADSSLWLSVPEVVSFLPLLRKLPIMPPKAEFLAMMAEKQRMGGADINRRSGWTQSVLAQWNEWLSSGIRKQVTEISLQIPVASLSKPVSVASAAKAPAAEKAKPSRIDEALRRAYDIAVLVEANTKVSPSRNTSRNPSRNPSPPRNDPPQSPAFSFAQGPDILSTMVSPVFETVPAVSDQRSFVPSAPTALEESEVERPIAALAEADATLAISEDDIPLAARAKAQVAATTIEPEPATSEEIPCSIEEEQEEEEELLRKSGSNASLASEPAYGGLLDIEDEPEPEQDAEPKTVVTLHDLLIKEEVDENRLSPMQGQGSMVLVAVPSPVVTETGEQAWDWEYQLVDRTELQAKVVSPVLERNPSAHGTGDGIIGDQQVAPMPELFAPVAGAETSLSVEKPVALKVVTRPIVGIEGDDQCLSQPDTMVPSGTSANPPPTTVIERQEPAIRQTLAAAPVRTPASEFHTPSNSEPAPIQASANVNAAPVPVAIPVPGLVPAVGPTNDNDEDRPLQARSSQVSLK